MAFISLYRLRSLFVSLAIFRLSAKFRLCQYSFICNDAKNDHRPIRQIFDSPNIRLANKSTYTAYKLSDYKQYQPNDLSYSHLSCFSTFVE